MKPAPHTRKNKHVMLDQTKLKKAQRILEAKLRQRRLIARLTG